MKYGCILADPPWAFKTFNNKSGTTPHRGAEDHYGVMPTADIAALPIGELAARDCALFMWVVDSHLPDAFKVAEGWGFQFKTRAFTWRKLTSTGVAKIGMGYWTRKQTEMCWLFTKGKPARIGKGVREIIDAPRREHSRKPDEQYERIQALVGGPYLEVFARQQWPGWDVWGNQTGKFKAAA